MTDALKKEFKNDSNLPECKKAKDKDLSKSASLELNSSDGQLLSELTLENNADKISEFYENVETRNLILNYL
jgi:hypothetical protein